MPGAQIPTSVTRLESMLGYQAVSLTNFDSSALSAIAAGSKVEIAGAFFTFTVDEAIEASTWTSIVTGNTAYIALIPAGTAGSQTVTAEYTATAPVWSTSKQGWYASAGSSTRVIGSVYKNEAASQHKKYIIRSNQDYVFRGITEKITSGSGNWIVPADVTRIRVTCVGGGASGHVGGGAGGGGGGGGTNISLAIADMLNVIPGQSLAYSVGAGGVGSDGNDTTFTGATTGGKGFRGAGVNVQGGLGSTGAGGSAGQCGNTLTAGSGGGAGGVGGVGASAGTSGNIGGGGGGGGPSGGAGGDGGSGIIIIEY